MHSVQPPPHVLAREKDDPPEPVIPDGAVYLIGGLCPMPGRRKSLLHGLRHDLGERSVTLDSTLSSRRTRRGCDVSCAACHQRAASHLVRSRDERTLQGTA
ncbi:hypothetical protein MTO96_004312 [Rhipicephalus appendiculatus]